MPEMTPDDAVFGRGAEGLRRAVAFARLHRRGRPMADEVSAPTSTRSIRFPEATWDELEKLAVNRGLSVHGLMRTIIVQWLSDHSLQRSDT